MAVQQHSTPALARPLLPDAAALPAIHPTVSPDQEFLALLNVRERSERRLEHLLDMLLEKEVADMAAEQAALPRALVGLSNLGDTHA